MVGIGKSHSEETKLKISQVMKNRGVPRKVKVSLDIDVVDALIKRKTFGDTYSDVIRELLIGR